MDSSGELKFRCSSTASVEKRVLTFFRSGVTTGMGATHAALLKAAFSSMTLANAGSTSIIEYFDTSGCGQGSSVPSAGLPPVKSASYRLTATEPVPSGFRHFSGAIRLRWSEGLFLTAVAP